MKFLSNLECTFWFGYLSHMRWTVPVTPATGRVRQESEASLITRQWDPISRKERREGEKGNPYPSLHSLALITLSQCSLSTCEDLGSVFRTIKNKPPKQTYNPLFLSFTSCKYPVNQPLIFALIHKYTKWLTICSIVSFQSFLRIYPNYVYACSVGMGYLTIGVCRWQIHWIQSWSHRQCLTWVLGRAALTLKHWASPPVVLKGQSQDSISPFRPLKLWHCLQDIQAKISSTSEIDLLGNSKLKNQLLVHLWTNHIPNHSNTTFISAFVKWIQLLSEETKQKKNPLSGPSRQQALSPPPCFCGIVLPALSPPPCFCGSPLLQLELPCTLGGQLKKTKHGLMGKHSDIISPKG
jgi:hypothetical protein